MERVNDTSSVRRRGGIFAVRNLLDVSPEVQKLACLPAVRRLVEPVLGPECFPVRGILFDKIPGANWKVPWHQDVTIAVKERREVAGYAPWSMKEGVVHVQPPTEVLENMLTVRVHLDTCSATNGALRVIPGSHRLGRLDQNKVGAMVDESRSVCCSAHPGDALIMRPLLLHASSASVEPTHRRVLHFDYAIGDLAGGLQRKMRDYSVPTLRQR